ncbi:MAG: protein-disulfide reductase DsbD family protein [Alphaproteobacteria bacterium]
MVLAAVAAAVVAVVPPAAAETASAWAPTDQTAVRLVAGVTAVGPGETVPLGLHFTLRPGWKVYWRSPGSGGLPPVLDWAASDNVADARIAWPAPKRFDSLGIESFGYADEVVFPIQLRLSRAGEAVRAAADVDYLTCREICIPYRATLSLSLPAGPADPAPEAALIARFLDHVPGDGAAHGVRIEGARLVGSGEDRRLEARIAASPPLAAPDLLVETDLPLDFSAPEMTAAAGGGTLLTARIAGDAAVIDRLAGSAVTLTLVDGARTAEAGATVSAAPAAGGPADLVLWATMLATALLGGLILNLMPCVLPVLSLKLLGVVEAGGRARAEARAGFVASAAGILVSFLVLAAGAVALKAGGHAVGWGIQFQQPWFLAVLATILVLFAANLWGWFHIPLPGFAQAAAGAPHHGPLGHFLTGAFAALMATPCSAPFLGTAVGFALSRGWVEIVAIFLALGTGLALPYLVIALFPGLATRLPRPGRWMNVVRRALALALVAAALWLLLVLAAQQGWVAAVGLAAVLAAAAILIGPAARLPAAWRTSIAAATLVAFAVVVVPRLSIAPPPAAAAVGGEWRPFDRQAIARLVAEGRTVFVDVTADWCITCQVNKKLVIGRGAVAERLADARVVPMRADWTRPDPAIATFLADHGRYGIPFNVVYGPGAPKGVALPELLTEGAVMDAFARAAGGVTTAAVPR